MTHALSQIAKALQLDFDGHDLEIDGIHTLTEATSTQLSFFTDKKYKSQLALTKAAAVFIDEKHASYLPENTIALITDESYLKLALASKFFAVSVGTQGNTPTIGIECDIDKSVTMGKNVTISNNVTILAGTYIGDNVKIGANSFIYPNVSIYHGSDIGEHCIIHSGTVIGCDGYGFAHTKSAEHIKIYQNGNVIIERDVEIGANCTIDRAVFSSTIIRKGTKLDNLIHIAHNCDLGEHTLLAAQVGLAGSTTLGRNVVMGGQSASAGHLKIDEFSTIAGKSGVTKSLTGHQNYAGFPAIEHKLWLKIQAKIAGLIRRKKE